MPKITIEIDDNDIFFLTGSLMKIDEEIGSTINCADRSDKNKIISNMKSANKALQDIKEMFKIKF